MRFAVWPILILTLTEPPAHAFSLKPTLAEMGGGVFKPDSQIIKALYNDHYSPEDPRNSIPVARATVGWFVYRVVSVSLGAGYFYTSGFGLKEPRDVPDNAEIRAALQTDGPTEENPNPAIDWKNLYQNPGLLKDIERTRDLYTLAAFPLQADARLNVHVWRNQWVIPFAEGGGEYILFRKARRQGKSDRDWYQKRAYHWGGGAMILLDVLDRYHANKMEDEWGIADTYLTLAGEQRKSIKNPGELTPLDFSGWTYTASLTFRLKSREP